MELYPLLGPLGSEVEVGSEQVHGLEKILPLSPLLTGLSPAPTTPACPGPLPPHLINLQTVRPAQPAGTPSRDSQIKLQTGRRLGL